MHHIYHTEGIILGSRNSGESGKHYHIFTRDLGLITATASGVRGMSSKLRFILQNFAYIKVDLVEGRYIFKITSASKTNALGDLTKHPGALKVFANIARLLRRLLAGVEANAALFNDMLQGLFVLEKISAGGKEDLQNFEAVMVLRILHNLGYIGDNEIVKNLVRSPFEDVILFEASESKSHIVRQINKALKETQL
jgi:DNA repair protein RecO